MNKSQLIDAVTDRLGSRREASTAVETVLDTVIRAVVEGDPVSVTGFGTIEARPRPARYARNPQTGSRMHLPARRAVRFRPGANFQDLVAGRKALPVGSAVKKAPKTPRP